MWISEAGTIHRWFSGAYLMRSSGHILLSLLTNGWWNRLPADRSPVCVCDYCPLMDVVHVAILMSVGVWVLLLGYTWPCCTWVAGYIPPRLIEITSQVDGLIQSAGAIRSEGLGFLIIQIPSGMLYMACPNVAFPTTVPLLVPVWPTCSSITMQVSIPYIWFTRGDTGCRKTGSPSAQNRCKTMTILTRRFSTSGVTAYLNLWSVT
jgi:hypothetical protein